jgi:hypothetical protein
MTVEMGEGKQGEKMLSKTNDRLTTILVYLLVGICAITVPEYFKSDVRIVAFGGPTTYGHDHTSNEMVLEVPVDLRQCSEKSAIPTICNLIRERESQEVRGNLILGDFVGLQPYGSFEGLAKAVFKLVQR